MTRARAHDHAESYWPGYVDLLVAVLVVVILGPTVKPSPQPTQSFPIEENSNTVTGPDQTFAQFRNKYFADQVRALSLPSGKLLKPLVSEVSGQGLTIHLAEFADLPSLSEQVSLLPAGYSEIVSRIWQSVLVSSPLSDGISSLGLMVTEGSVFAYADKDFGTGPEVNTWLRALHNELKRLQSATPSASGVMIDIKPYYSDSAVPRPYLAVRFALQLSPAGLERAKDAYRKIGGHV